MGLLLFSAREGIPHRAMGCFKRVLERTDYRMSTLVIRGWSEEVGFTLDAVIKWLVIWIYLIYREETSTKIKLFIIGREVAVTYFRQERKGAWYLTGDIVVKFLSVPTHTKSRFQNNLVWGWYSVRSFMSGRRITCFSCECHASFWVSGAAFYFIFKIS